MTKGLLYCNTSIRCYINPILIMLSRYHKNIKLTLRKNNSDRALIYGSFCNLYIS